MTRTGKIARLSRSAREELNRRLRDGEQGKQLVIWLNSQPEIQSMLALEFGGRPISEQNLSEWKQGGYGEWLVHRDALERARNLAADAGELTVAAGALADHLAIVLATRYAAALARWDGNPNRTSAQNIRTLRALCQDIVELRRGDHSAARLKVEQEWLELERSKDEERIQERFEKWVLQPEVRNRIFGPKLTPARKGGLSSETLALVEKAANLM